MVRHCYIHDTGAGGVRIGEPDNNDIPTRQIFPENEPEKTLRVKVDNNIIASGGSDLSVRGRSVDRPRLRQRGDA